MLILPFLALFVLGAIGIGIIDTVLIATGAVALTVWFVVGAFLIDRN